jgi:hypothetical protein
MVLSRGEKFFGKAPSISRTGILPVPRKYGAVHRTGKMSVLLVIPSIPDLCR